MGRIKNKNTYSIKNNPSVDDYVIGSDSENNGKTVNFLVGDLVYGGVTVPEPKIPFQYSDLNKVSLKFEWNKYKPDYNKLSSRIRGSYNLLKVYYKNYDLLKNKDNGEEYVLLIDRYRSTCNKGQGLKKHDKYRPAGYKHEIIPNVDNNNTQRKNQFEILSDNMLLDFNQDFYFKPMIGKLTDYLLFPAPTGTATKRSQTNSTKKGSSIRKGWVDLAFRIGVNIDGKRVYETNYIGYIRMLGISDFSRGEYNLITYSVK